jgi:cell division septation protein DedD
MKDPRHRKQMMEQGSVRNLEQIQESDDESRTPPRGVTILLVALGGACVVFAGLALGGRHTANTLPKADPLGALVSQQGKPGASAVYEPSKPMDLAAKDVTFPGMLSDESSPTTALAVVKAPPGAKVASSKGPGADDAVALNVRPASPGADSLLREEGAPPPASDRLPVVPLPAQHLLEASPVVTRPRDALTRAAAGVAQIGNAAQPSAPAGREGGYQLQVSSFRTQAEADEFSAQLRARGHKAYAMEARVPGRGTWFRVRIGPFPSQHAAASYRTGFEGREHVVPFIVPPAAKSTTP